MLNTSETSKGSIDHDSQPSAQSLTLLHAAHDGMVHLVMTASLCSQSEVKHSVCTYEMSGQ